MNLPELMKYGADLLSGWTFIIFIMSASVLYTILLRGIQFRYFLQAWKETLFPTKSATEAKQGDMSPVQAFINTLSTNIGNGSLAGMATAVYAGGPGAAFWAVAGSIFLMAIKFAEVFLSTAAQKTSTAPSVVGGPMLYLRSIPGGRFIAYCYGVLCFAFALTVANAMQANSIRLSLSTAFGIGTLPITVVLALFSMYVVLGGTPRIVKISDALVPLKIIVFFGCSFIIIAYHYAQLWEALRLVFSSAFQPIAFAGGALGFTVQQAMSFGINRSIGATESGLGTAAIFFGFTDTKNPFQSSLMAMLSTFISALVCFLVAFCIVISGTWQSGLTSTALTTASYASVFGSYGGYLVSFLSISFGAGVLVSYIYVTRAIWLFLTGGRWASFVLIAVPVATVLGSLGNVDMLWDFTSIISVLLLFINIGGLLWLSPSVVRAMRSR